MWTCSQCKAAIEDEDVFCYSCGAPRHKIACSWECTECHAEMEDTIDFCSKCGQPKEKKRGAVSLPPTKSVNVTEDLTSMVPAVTPVSISVQAVEMASQVVYDTAIFASQFPQWDLLPPAVLVKRIKRSI